MNSRALGSLLLIVVGVGIAVLWYRGYFNSIITNAVTAIGGSGVKNPITPWGGTVYTSPSGPTGNAPVGQSGLGSTIRRV
jgi:hypothetical protein